MSLRIHGIGMTSRRTRNRMIGRLQEQGIKNTKVLGVMINTPRHIFVDDALSSYAYEDTALPIGYNQTISQPYIVAKMIELLLEHGPVSKVLEVGLGSGYQTAVLAQCVNKVYSMERILSLFQKAKHNLSDLNFKNIYFLHADGCCGWDEKSPFDGILVSASAFEIPKALLQQMAIGGVMLIPIGTKGCQKLHKVVRTKTTYEYEILESVSFVPLL